MLLLLIYCLMYFPLFVRVLCLSLFCYVLLCFHSSFAIILKRKRKLVVLLLLSYRCIDTINVLWLFLMVPWVRLQCVILVFPDHTHLPFKKDPIKVERCAKIRNRYNQVSYLTKNTVWESVKTQETQHTREQRRQPFPSSCCKERTRQHNKDKREHK